jgi:hypothetical protein
MPPKVAVCDAVFDGFPTQSCIEVPRQWKFLGEIVDEEGPGLEKRLGGLDQAKDDARGII